MLILKAHQDEWIVVDGPARICISGGETRTAVKLAIDAPPTTNVTRERDDTKDLGAGRRD